MDASSSSSQLPTTASTNAISSGVASGSHSSLPGQHSLINPTTNSLSSSRDAHMAVDATAGPSSLSRTATVPGASLPPNMTTSSLPSFPSSSHMRSSPIPSRHSTSQRQMRSMTPGLSSSSLSMTSSAQFGSPLTYDSFWSSHSSSVGAYGLRGLNASGVGTPAGSSFTGSRGGPLDPTGPRFGGAVGSVGTGGGDT